MPVTVIDAKLSDGFVVDNVVDEAVVTVKYKLSGHHVQDYLEVDRILRSLKEDVVLGHNLKLRPGRQVTDMLDSMSDFGWSYVDDILVGDFRNVNDFLADLRSIVEEQG